MLRLVTISLFIFCSSVHRSAEPCIYLSIAVAVIIAVVVIAVAVIIVVAVNNSNFAVVIVIPVVGHCTHLV